MKVLHVDSGRDMRGGQWQVIHLLQTAGEGHMLLCAGHGPLLAVARERSLDARPLSMSALFQLSRSADITHVHDARSHSWAATLSGSPVVVSRRVGFPVGQSWISQWKYSRPSRFIAVSQYVKRTLTGAGVPENKISVVYDGVPIPRETARGGDRIVALASTDRLKGTDLLEKAAKLGDFTVRYSTDLQADLQDAALFIYVTRTEGLGSAALVAMAAGVPVVASRVGGLPEIVRHGETGLLTSNEPGEIAATVRSALENRENFRRRARAWVIEHCTVEKMVEDTIRVYGQVLS